MVASRLRPKGGLVTPFGLSILAFLVSAERNRVAGACGAGCAPAGYCRTAGALTLLDDLARARRDLQHAAPGERGDAGVAELRARRSRHQLRRHDRLDPRAPARRSADGAGRRRGAGREPRAQGRPPAASAKRAAGRRDQAPRGDADQRQSAREPSRPSRSPSARSSRRAPPVVAESSPRPGAPRNPRAATPVRRRRTCAAPPPNSATAWRSASASPAKRPIRRS